MSVRLFRLNLRLKAPAPVKFFGIPFLEQQRTLARYFNGDILLPFPADMSPFRYTD